MQVLRRGLPGRHGRRAGPLARDPRRGADRARRPFGVREDNRAPHGGGAGGDHGGRDPDRGQGRQRASAPGPRRRHGLPELRALPAQDGVREPLVPAQAAQAEPKRHRRPGAADRQGARARGAAPAQARPALRGPAPAGGDGPGDDPRALRVPDGRAPLEPRREAADPDARRDRADPQGARCDDDLRHARPGRGDDARRARRRDAQGRATAGRRAPGALQPPGEPLRGRLHRQPGDELLPRAGVGAAPAVWVSRSATGSGSGVDEPSARCARARGMDGKG